VSNTHKIAADKRWSDPEYRRKMSKIRKALWKNANYRTHTMKARQKVYDTPAHHRKMSAAQFRRYKDKDQKMLRSIKQQELNSDPIFRMQHRDRLIKRYATDLKPNSCGHGVFVHTHKAGNIICHGSTCIEWMFAVLCDFIDTVKYFKKDHIRIPYTWKGVTRTFFPDFYVTMITGEKRVIEFSTRPYSKDKFKFKVAKKFCKKKGYTFIVSYKKEIDLDEMLNLISIKGEW
jgi:hypothetical protein